MTAVAAPDVHPLGRVISAEDEQAARALWDEIGRPENCYPSAAQLVAFIRQAPDHIAEDYAAAMLRASELEVLCRVRHQRSSL